MEASLKTRQKKAAFTNKERQSIYNTFETYRKEHSKLKKKDCLSYTAKTAGVCESSVVKIVREKGEPKKLNKNMRVWARSSAEASMIVSRMLKEQEDQEEKDKTNSIEPPNDEHTCFEDFFDQIWETPSLIKLPTKSWALHKIPKKQLATESYNVICIAEMSTTPNGDVFTKKKVVISREALIEFYLNNEMMDGMYFMPEIGTVAELQDYLDDFHANNF